MKQRQQAACHGSPRHLARRASRGLSLIHRIAIALALTCGAGTALAGKPGCGTASGVNYCYYTGKVVNSYVNSGNVILMYFDTAFGSTSEINIPGATTLGACAVLITDNPAFGKLFYASILTAQTSGRNVSVQMRGTLQGTLVCDRIWVEN